MLQRRQFIRIGVAGGVSLALPWGVAIPKGWDQVLAAGLLDPEDQLLFTNAVPNALAPGFIYQPKNAKKQNYTVGVYPLTQSLGLRNAAGTSLMTPLFAYGDALNTATFPGKTFEVQSGKRITVKWENNLIDPVLRAPLPHFLPIDKSLHWAYSLHGYTQYSLETNGVPIVPHVHGGHTESESDGNPEYFFSPGYAVRGPRWVKRTYSYDNDQEAGTVWYHDHALGITRMNVYAGMAGFYIIRDNMDTGKPDNPLDLPAYPYESAFAIQDRMFKENGELFFPAFPGDPFYDDFITGEGAVLPSSIFSGGGPTALAEFFGDHILVNGQAWPKMDVEPRNYRFRLLNGSDSRFYVFRLRQVALSDTGISGTAPVVPFYQIGTDDGFLGQPVLMDANTPLIMGPGERADIVVDFSQVPADSRIILENLGPDAPFGGDYGVDLAPEDFFPLRQTDRIMAFDVIKPFDNAVPDNFNPGVNLRTGGQAFTVPGTPTTTRKLALFEGLDEFGRLQPLLGVVDPNLSEQDGTIPITQPTNGALGWFQDITENPGLDDVEIWEIYNVTGDAHPIHVHLVAFEVLNRQELGTEGVDWEVSTRPQPQHNSIEGNVPLDPDFPTGSGPAFPAGEGYYGKANTLVLLNGDGTGGNLIKPALMNERGPKDTVQAFPGEVTRIKMKFDRPGRYVWHCHILSHEDHEMMRPYHIGIIPAEGRVQSEVASINTESYPNPFFDQTAIKVELPKAGRLEIRVFDAAGRLIRTLGNSHYEAGTHAISWDANGRWGAKVATGVYFYQVIFDGKVSANGKMIREE